MASDTKALTGHSDLILGHVATQEQEWADRLRAWRRVSWSTKPPVLAAFAPLQSGAPGGVGRPFPRGLFASVRAVRTRKTSWLTSHKHSTQRSDKKGGRRMRQTRSGTGTLGRL